MEGSGVSSSMKEPDKCDNKHILLLRGMSGKTGQQMNDDRKVDSNIVPCDSTSGNDNSSAQHQDQVNDKKEAEKMTIDEASCG